MIHQVVYQSIARKELSTSELDQIHQVSVKNNGPNDIGGCLIYHEQKFFQILEGETDAVEALFDKIKKDPRHKEVLTLGRFEWHERLFNMWNMAFINANESTDLYKSKLQFEKQLLDYAKIAINQAPASSVFWQNIHRFLTHKRPRTKTA